ncbi:DUF4129 domain-containing protein [Halanaerobium kushneri]|uniref:Protein-glutamine gamma-glutamyltransferase-like C-terminal domain-containing protein n=1 Tax=Halanaerobium kushneri TaxID=56779 RepID=A0A1N6VHE8_9FIRM|nr:DUF4129 domain-containing protein [Halanaerobium kushneri]SIQ77272.1 protein of unknown function [Halanaerobium kushneri]
MKAKEYNFKYSYLYPFMGVMLYFILAIMFFYLIEINSNFMNLNNFSYLILFLFLVEAILHFNASLEIKIPMLTFVVEFFVYLLLLVVLSGRYQSLATIFSLDKLDLFIFWLVSIFFWYQVYEFCGIFEYFRKDFDKIYESKGEDWNLDEFRRLLDYPLIWPRMTRKVSWLNLPLLILWAFIGEVNMLFLILTIIFLVTEVFLLALTYLDKKTVDWNVNRIKETQSIKKGWRKFLLIFIILALLLAFLLPSNYQPLPMDRINSWIGQQLALLGVVEMEQQDNIRERFDAGQLPDEAEEEEPRWIEILFVIIQIFLTVIFALFFLALVIFFITSEIGKLKNMPQFFKAFYQFIIKALKDIFTVIKEINFTSGWRKRNERLKNKKSAKEEAKNIKNIELTGQSNSIIIRIYNSLLRLLSLKGMGKDPAATPYEYRSYLVEKFQDLKEEINNLTEIFVETAYSDHPLGENAVKTARTIWKILKKKI